MSDPQDEEHVNGNESPESGGTPAEPVIAMTIAEFDEMQQQLESARAEAEKQRDSLQRALADYNNLRRRTDQEREQMRGDLVGKILNPFLEVLDDLELAVRKRPLEGPESAWGEGIELVYRKLVGRLESQGVRLMETEGVDFDPHFHEAITHEENEDFKSGQIIAVVKPGYMIGDRVLRPAMVRVAA